MTKSFLCATMALAAGLCGTTHAAAADEAAPAAAGDRGFSYFMGLGAQSVRYQEKPSIVPAETSVRATSPLLVTGALYEINDQLMFSMDSETTFAPRRATETWTSTAPVFNGVTLTDRVVQKNGFTLSQNHTQLLGHYRVAGPLFASGGVGFRSQSFKRFAFEVGADKAVSIPAGTTVEESSSEVLLNVGMAFDTERVRDAALHHGVRVMLGLPVWRQLTNTNSPTLEFNGTKGWDFAVEGRSSIAVMRNVHVGAWGKWNHSMRGREVAGNVELPRSTLDSLSVGLELLWKL